MAWSGPRRHPCGAALAVKTSALCHRSDPPIRIAFCGPLRASGNLDLVTALYEVADWAHALTGAQFGVKGGEDQGSAGTEDDRGGRAAATLCAGRPLLRQLRASDSRSWGRPAASTAMEYDMLFELSVSAGRVLTHEHLLRRVWRPDDSGDAGLVPTIAKRLCQKLRDGTKNPSTFSLPPRLLTYAQGRSASRRNGVSSLRRRSLSLMSSRWVHRLPSHITKMVLPTAQEHPTEFLATIRRRVCLSSRRPTCPSGLSQIRPGRGSRVRCVD